MADILQMHIQINHPLAGKEESFFLTTNDKNAAKNLAREYINIRKRLFARDVGVIGASITTWGPPPDSTPLVLGYPYFNNEAALLALSQLPGSFNNTGTENVLPDGSQADDVAVNQPKNAFSIRYIAAGGARGDRYTAFIPDSYLCGGRFAVELPGELVAGTSIGTISDSRLNDNPAYALRTLIQWILNNTSHGFLAFNPRFIKSVSNEVNAMIETRTKNTITNGATVEISGVQGALVNGQWTATVIDNKHFRIDNAALPGVYTGGGKVTAPRETLALEAWRSAFVVRPTGKNVGRPLSPFRGRQSARRAS